MPELWTGHDVEHRITHLKIQERFPGLIITWRVRNAASRLPKQFPGETVSVTLTHRMDNHLGLSSYLGGRADSDLANDCILPGQMRARRELTPEQQLAFAVLMAGIEDACGGPGGRRERLRNEAVEWMQCDSRLEPFAFVSLCELFDLDPGAIRRGVLGAAVPIRAGRGVWGGVPGRRPGAVAQKPIGAVARHDVDTGPETWP
jgi:hypothetical protein